MYRFWVKTEQRTQIVDITGQVKDVVARDGVVNGLVTVFVPHTTAAVTINENADPTVKKDLLQALAQIAPLHTAFYEHREGNSDAHIKASLMGASVSVPVSEGRIFLGTWQGILFCEFDGPRSREVWVQVLW